MATLASILQDRYNRMVKSKPFHRTSHPLGLKVWMTNDMQLRAAVGDSKSYPFVCDADDILANDWEDVDVN